ncbi:MAG TPA: FAD:protein FMN transferase [Acidimicrobiales bacterium]|nr:FAD:protein FMN transferase [Acidimicrobiales bacterium]
MNPELCGSYTRSVAMMGTVFSFDLRAPASARAAAAQAVDAAVGWLRWVDNNFSTYKENSAVNRFDRGELAAGDVASELARVLALCHQFNKESEGYFDAWAGGRFDPSGVVKGWSIEAASELLNKCGFADHCVDGGGDLRLRGLARPGTRWTVGLRHPLQRAGLAAALALGAGAVATSGTYERGTHVVDPMTGRAATDLAAVTVVGPDLVAADAYATAALAMGARAPDWLCGLCGYESQVITPAGRGWSTPGFKRLRVA